tara:strand:+ start:1009 stop:1182 length:174 start_codon:yes stop_codon:yes gene_type:complete
MDDRDHLDIVDFIENTLSYTENSIDAYQENDIDLDEFMLKILDVGEKPIETQLDLMP